MNEQTELLNCPFCGEPAEYWTEECGMYMSNECAIVGCSICRCEMRGEIGEKDYLIEKWNKRFSDY